MVNLPKVAYKYRVVFFSIMIFVVIGGVYSFFTIPKLEDPEITVMQCMVVTVYPGASAEEVEKQVTDIIEREIRTIPNISEIKSVSEANISQISVLLNFSVPDKEIVQYWDILRKKLRDIQPHLPSGVQAPIVIDDFSDVFGMFYAITSDGFSYEEMNQYANTLKKELLNVDGVKRINTFGFQPNNINIELSAEKMSQLGIYPAQIAMAVSSASSPLYSGYYRQGNNNIRTVVDGNLKSIDDIRNLTLSGFENDVFRLQDIARITIDRQDPARFTFLYNGKPALAFGISMESNVNVVDVGRRVDSKMKTLMQDIPVGIDVDKIFFQPDKVTSAIGHFMRDFILAVVIVIVVLMLAMNFRSGLIVCASLIIIVCAVFPILEALGGTLQRISLGALILALGMLVDDSIVVIDSILIALQHKKPLKVALFEYPKKTAMPLLTGTAIAIICFLPVYLSNDAASTYIGDLFLVLCIALGISWFVSLTQVPVFAGLMLNLRKNRSGEQKPFSGKFFNALRTILDKMMVHKKTTIAATFLFLAVALYGFYHVKMTFFPDFLYNQAYIEFTLPKDASAEQTIGDMQKISEDLQKMEGVEKVAASHGMTPMRYCLVRAVTQVGDNYAEFIVDFKNYRTMQKLRPKIEKYLYDKYPDAYSRFRLYNLSIMATHTVEVEFDGPDQNVLRDLAKQATKIMLESPEVNPYSVSTDVSDPTKILSVEFAQDIAAKMGTMRTDLSNTLLAATDGVPIGAFVEKNKQPIPINLKIRDKNGNRVTDFHNLPVWNLLPNFRAIEKEDLQRVVAGYESESELQKKVISAVPLDQLSRNIDIGWEESTIIHNNLHKSIQAQCDAKISSSAADVVSDIQDKIEKIDLPQGYSMSWIGERLLMKFALKNIIKLLPLTGIIIVFLLILLFNDIKRTLIVILCVPLALIGVVPGLLITSQPFSFVAIVGTIGLSGMLIRNSVVLIDAIDMQIGAGKDRYNAVIEATISRLRAVTMTSSATMLGVIPLLPDPMYGPLAVVIISGLLAGTVITLVLLPLLYSIFFGIKKEK